MEIWNNVFSQFNNDGNGNYTELKQKNIDTGMGLERLACVMQGVDNMFEVDTNRRILDAVCEAAGKTYGKDAANDVSIRVCTDHIKSAMFMIADGVIPSNEGRGYVLRRIIRRACRHGKLLGIDRPFLVGLCRVAMQENEGAYPELSAKRDYILKVLSIEEERFKPITASAEFTAEKADGFVEIEFAVDSSLLQGKTVVAFETILYKEVEIAIHADIEDEGQTVLFPNANLLAVKGLSLDEDTFRTLMAEQRERARAARGNVGGWSEGSKNLLAKLDKTEFLGYDQNECEAKVIAVVAEDELVETASEGEVSVIFDRTVFYGEGGGQVGDTGTLKTKGGVTLAVTDTKKSDGVYIHFVTVSDGAISVGDTVTLKIDGARRDAIRRNHSACHLLQGALRRVLGAHAEQAGSYVDEHRARFDFSHFAALTPKELAEVERQVNEAILSDIPVETQLTDMETAKKSGAMALFGEKYGKVVRMVKMGDASTELCGGTHVRSTGRIGLFRVTSETSVAAGVRRIEAVTGFGVLSLLSEKDELIQKTAKELKAVNPLEIAKRAAQVGEELKQTKRALESAEAKLATADLDKLLDNVKTVGAYQLLTARLSMKPDAVRTLCDSLKEKRPAIVAVFAAVSDGKLNFVAACGNDAVKNGAHAGKILSTISAIAGGKGGGRPDSAMSGGRDLDKIDAALAAVETLL